MSFRKKWPWRNDRKKLKVPVAPPVPVAEVRIFADASVDQEEKHSGWGAWVMATGMERPFYRGGPFRDTFGGSPTMELAALSNGLRIAERLNLLRPKVSVLLQSDNVPALYYIMQRFGAAEDSEGIYRGTDGTVRISNFFGIPANAELAACNIRGILDRTKVALYVRHVKGHATITSDRTDINALCDKLAGQGRRLAEKGRFPKDQDPYIL